jgi:hypothetical protein
MEKSPHHVHGRDQQDAGRRCRDAERPWIVPKHAVTQTDEYRMQYVVVGCVIVGGHGAKTVRGEVQVGVCFVVVERLVDQVQAQSDADDDNECKRQPMLHPVQPTDCSDTCRIAPRLNVVHVCDRLAHRVMLRAPEDSSG